MNLNVDQVMRAVDQLVLLAEECIDERDICTAEYLLDLASGMSDDVGLDCLGLVQADKRLSALLAEREGDDGLGE